MLPPDPHVVAVWLVALLALYLFGQDRIPHETTALGLLVALVLGLHVFPYDGPFGRLTGLDVFTRLGHEALVSIAAFAVLAKGLEVTGALSPLLGALTRLWMQRPRIAALVTLLLALILSAFVSNTPVVVMLMPLLVGVAMRSGTAPSELLMPIGFAALIGGMATVIGATTNLLVVGLAADLELAPIGLFDFALPVALAAVPAVLYLWLLAPRLLPARAPPLTDTSTRIFSAVLRIEEGSAAAGHTLPEVLAMTGSRMRIDRIQRGENLFLAKLPSVRVQPGDRLHVHDLPERLKEYERALGATLAPDGAAAETPLEGDAEGENAAGAQQLAEVVVTRGALLHRSTLAKSRFASRFGLLPLAVHRSRGSVGEPARDIAQVELRAGDVLLVQGSRKSFSALRDSNAALVLDGTLDLPHTGRAPFAIAVMVAVVVAIAGGWLPVSVCAVAGVGVMLLGRCLSWSDIITALNTRLIFVVAAALAIAMLMHRSGAGAALAEALLALTAGWSPGLVLVLFMAALIVLTNVAANTVVAGIAVPVAVPLAQGLGAAPMAFLLGALFAASLSYIRPAGYQTNLLLLTTGGYRPTDFLRFGGPLVVLLWLSLAGLLVWQYGL